jgi:hypothetical protein
MKISVAMATYNGASYLREQLGSMLGQTVLPSELVVSDDGSSDGTLDIIRAFARSAPFEVRILQKTQRLGFSDNFLNAAEACVHDVVSFCDQDDIWLPAKLETGLRRIEQDGSLLSLHRLSIVDENLCPSGEIWTQEIARDEFYEPLKLDPYINGWGNSMMVRRELVHLVPRASRPPQPERNHLPLSHDTWIYVLAAALGRVSHIMAPLLLYRQHSSNAEGVKAPGRRQRLLRTALGPTLRLAEHSKFSGAMVPIFAEVGARGAEPLAGPARAAAVEFARRRDHLAELLTIYAAPSFAARLRAFRAVKARLAGSPPRRGALLKQFVIGVAGINRALGKS